MDTCVCTGGGAMTHKLTVPVMMSTTVRPLTKRVREETVEEHTHVRTSNKRMKEKETEEEEVHTPNKRAREETMHSRRGREENTRTPSIRAREAQEDNGYFTKKTKQASLTHCLTLSSLTQVLFSLSLSLPLCVCVSLDLYVWT